MLKLTKKTEVEGSIKHYFIIILVQSHQLVVDEELLPFKDESFNLVTSCLSLHWTNNLDLALKEIRRVLKPDGYFSGCVFGGESLKEIKECFFLAETEMRNKVSPRINPQLQCSEIAWLLQTNDFNIGHVDHKKYVLEYDSFDEIIKHIRNMGEQLSSNVERLPLTKKIVNRVKHIYNVYLIIIIQNELKNENNGKVLVTCDVIFFGGWCPCKTQQLPLKPSKPAVNLKDLLTKENNQELYKEMNKEANNENKTTNVDGHRYGMKQEELDEMLKKNDSKKD